MKYTTYTIELLADTSTPELELKALTKFHKVIDGCGMKVTRKKVKDIPIMDLHHDLVCHYMDHGRLPKNSGPKQVGSNEYKRVHKQVRKILGIKKILDA